MISTSLKSIALLCLVVLSSLRVVSAWAEGSIEEPQDDPVRLLQVWLDWRTEWFNIALPLWLGEDETITISWVKASEYSIQWPVDPWTYHIHDWESSTLIGTCSALPQGWINISDSEPWNVTIRLWAYTASYERDESITWQVNDTTQTLYRNEQWVLSVHELTECGNEETVLEQAQSSTPTVPGELQWPEPQLDQWTRTIEEVHPKNDQYGEYVEIVCNKCIWTYTLIWFWSWSKQIPVHLDELFSWRLVLTGDWSILEQYIPIDQIWSMSLTDSWELLEVYGQYGQVMDTVLYEWWVLQNQSWFRSWQIDRATPWIWTELWDLMKPEQEVCESVETDLESASSSTLSTAHCISSIDPRQQKYDSLAKELVDAWHAIRKNWSVIRNYPEQVVCPEPVIVIPSNTQSSSINVAWNEIVKQEEPIQQETTYIWTLSIQSLLPNPEWTDSWFEQLVVHSSTGRVDVEELTIETNWKLKHIQTSNDAYTRSVDENLLLIEWSLGLINAQACVVVSVDEESSSEMCYDKAESWVPVLNTQDLTVTTMQEQLVHHPSLLQTTQRYQTTLNRMREEQINLEQQLTYQEAQQELSDDLFFLWKNHIQDTSPWVYDDTLLKRSYTVYRDLKESRENLLSEGTLPVETFESYIAVQTWSLPLWDLSLSRLLDEYIL